MGFTLWQWYYNKTQHAKYHTALKQNTAHNEYKTKSKAIHCLVNRFIDGVGCQSYTPAAHYPQISSCTQLCYRLSKARSCGKIRFSEKKIKDLSHQFSRLTEINREKRPSVRISITSVKIRAWYSRIQDRNYNIWNHLFVVINFKYLIAVLTSSL
jgi:hypothetical protein